MLKRIYWSLFLRPSFSLFVVFLYFIFGSLMLLGLSWNSSADGEIMSARSKWGLKAIVQVNAKKLFEAKANKVEIPSVPSSHLKELKENERFLPSQFAALTLNQAEEMSKSPEVKSAQYISVTNVVGKNFLPVVPTENTSDSLEVTDGLAEPQFQLIGVLKSEVVDEFKNTDNILISGSDISPADLYTKNAIIEHSLAVKNKLKLGNSFELTSLDGKHTQRFVVSGIFVATKSQNTGLSGKLSFLSNKNQIYVSVSEISALKGGISENPDIDKAVYTLQNPGFYKKFRFYAMEKGITLPVYDIYEDDSQFKFVSNQMKKGKSVGTSLTFTIFVCIFMFTFLIFVNSRRKRAAEIQALLLFGESTRFVFVQLLLEAVLLISVGFILAIIVSPLSLVKMNYFINEVTSYLNDNNVDSVVRTGKYFINMSNTNIESTFLNLNQHLNFIDQLGLVLIGLFLSVNAAILSLISVLRKSNRNLLMDSDLEET